MIFPPPPKRSFLWPNRRVPNQNKTVPVLHQTPALDHEQLRDVTMGDQELIRELLGALWNDTVAQIAKLAAAVQAADADQCARLAHYSKGACANVGANAAASTFRRIESDARAREFEKCSESLAALGDVMEQLRGEMRAFGA